jgi:hypothetical protein
MAKRPSDLFPAVIGGGVILLALFFHSIYEDLLKGAVLKRLSAFMGMPEAELVSRLAEMAGPIIGAVAVIWIVLWYDRRELRAEIPDPLIEAHRQHTEALRAQTEALKTKPKNADSTASGDRSSAIALAGMVNGLMERALQYGFKMAAVPPGDPFTQLYQEVKNSIDPVWIDGEIGQLRRDFLQYCAIVGSDDRSLKERNPDRTQLRDYGMKLIGRLTGTETISPDIWKSVPEAIEAFADPGLIGKRDEWKEKFEGALLLGYEAEDKISTLRKQMGGIFGADSTGELAAGQRKLELAAMQSDMARDELRRTWDELRADIHDKLLSGNLIARGFRRPHALGSPEVVIPAPEWRILFLQNVTSEASGKTSSEALYEGIVIRKRVEI